MYRYEKGDLVRLTQAGADAYGMFTGLAAGTHGIVRKAGNHVVGVSWQGGIVCEGMLAVNDAGELMVELEETVDRDTVTDAGSILERMGLDLEDFDV